MSERLWLVTGGAGFIGSNIVQELMAKGERVRILDNFSTGKMRNIKLFLSKTRLIKGDVRNLRVLEKAMKGVTHVLHQAALRSVPKSVDKPFETNEVNVGGTLNVLMAARKAGVRRVVYASSSSVYGDCKKFPQKEDMALAPVSPYAVSKLAGENYCVVFARTYGLETVGLRYFNVFGPRQDPESRYSAVVPKFMESFKKEKPLEVHWDGRQSRDFTYVANVVDANIKAALAPRKVSGNFYNVAAGETVSLLEIIRALEKITGRKPKRFFKPKRAGDVRKTWADPSRAVRDLKFRTLVSFRDGLEKTWEYFRDAAGERKA